MPSAILTFVSVAILTKVLYLQIVTENRDFADESTLTYKTNPVKVENERYDILFYIISRMASNISFESGRNQNWN